MKPSLTLLRPVAVVVLAGLALVLAAAPGQAHSTEVASDPADRSRISAVPAVVTLTFNENVIGLGTRVQVTGPDGDVTDGASTVTDNLVRQAIAPDAPAGTYTVDWRVTSADGHPVSGSFTFTATQAAGSPPAAASSAPGSEAVTAAPTTAAATTGSDTGDGGKLGSLSVIGLGVIVLVVLIALTAAISAVLRSRREDPRD